MILMKKAMGVLPLALALVMTVAFPASVSAAGSSDGKMTVQSVNPKEMKGSVQASGGGAFKHQISFFGYYRAISKKSPLLQISIKDSGKSQYSYEVQLLNYKRKVIDKDTVDAMSTTALFKLRKNKLYYYKVRAMAYDYTTQKYEPASKWSYGKSVNTAECKVTVYKKTNKLKIKVPKVKGIKKFGLYMSAKSRSGFRKVKSVRPGKSVTISKFKGKKFKSYKSYYYKVVSGKKQKGLLSGFRIYTVYK